MCLEKYEKILYTFHGTLTSGGQKENKNNKDNIYNNSQNRDNVANSVDNVDKFKENE